MSNNVLKKIKDYHQRHNGLLKDPRFKYKAVVQMELGGPVDERYLFAVKQGLAVIIFLGINEVGNYTVRAVVYKRWRNGDFLEVPAIGSHWTLVHTPVAAHNIRKSVDLRDCKIFITAEHMVGALQLTKEERMGHLAIEILEGLETVFLTSFTALFEERHFESFYFGFSDMKVHRLPNTIWLPSTYIGMNETVLCRAPYAMVVPNWLVDKESWENEDPSEWKFWKNCKFEEIVEYIEMKTGKVAEKMKVLINKKKESLGDSEHMLTKLYGLPREVIEADGTHSMNFYGFTTEEVNFMSLLNSSLACS